MEDHRRSHGGLCCFPIPSFLLPFRRRLRSNINMKLFLSSISQCYNGRTLIATYEPVTSPDKKATARLTIKHPGLPICTEIVTALLLNRMALAFGWPDVPFSS